MIRLLHLADLHLGWQPHFIAEPAAAQAYATARQGVFSAAIDAAVDPRNAVDAVIIAGDLFDGHRPAAALVEQVVAGLARLEARGIHVVTVPGNHDELTYSDSVYRMHGHRWPGKLVTSPSLARALVARCRGGDLLVDSMAYTGGITDARHPVSIPAVGSEAGVHVLAMHGTVVSAGEAGYGRLESVDERSLPIDGASLANAGYAYAALGHIHRPGPVAGGGPGRYAGLVAGRGFADPGCGYLSLVSLEAAPAAPQVTPLAVDLPACRRVAIDVGGLGAFAEVLAKAAAAVEGLAAGSLLEVTLTGQAGDRPDQEAIAAALQARFGLLHVVVRDETSLLDAVRLRTLGAENTLRGFFVRRLLSPAEPASGDAAGAERARRLRDAALRYGLAALERERR